LLAPFLAHNFSNTSATICGYIISGVWNKELIENGYGPSNSH
jgi:hypothetical protein